MMKTDTLGHFEQLVLTAVLMLDKEAYGMEVSRRVTELGGKPVKLPAVYLTLDRLQDKGYVSSELLNPTPERGGRLKRYFRVEKPGQQALKESAETAKRIIAESWTRILKWKPTRARSRGGHLEY